MTEGDLIISPGVQDNLNVENSNLVDYPNNVADLNNIASLTTGNDAQDP